MSLDNQTEKNIEKTPAVMERLAQMAEKGLSPTSLVDYVNDPIEFYKKRVLQLKEADEVEEVAGYATQGNVVHHLLEKFYTDVGGDPKKTLLPADAVFYYRETSCGKWWWIA
ncbi:MAG: PD-(D/E)XK nuclease family protein [Owenweeksia sp.]|nr:PD-(D/E)XK nuclease family protein [Owenweeksia sp.]